jgi:hypothetical protein
MNDGNDLPPEVMSTNTTTAHIIVVLTERKGEE